MAKRPGQWPRAPPPETFMEARPLRGASPMIERPRGTNDWGPEDMAKRRFVESRFVQLAESFGFRGPRLGDRDDARDRTEAGQGANREHRDPPFPPPVRAGRPGPRPSFPRQAQLRDARHRAAPPGANGALGAAPQVHRLGGQR